MLLTTLIFSYFFSFLSSKNKQTRNICLTLCCLTLIIFQGFQYNIGVDYLNYRAIFRKVVLNIKMDKVLEFGFYHLIKIIHFLKLGPQMMFLVMSIITNYLLILSFNKYSLKYKIKFYDNIYFFITTGLYLSAFNGIRQWFAIAIFFLAIEDIVLKKTKTYIIKILIGSLFHKSAIFLLPLYFIKNIKLKRYHFFIFYLLSFLIFKFGLFQIFIFKFTNLMPGYYRGYLNSVFAQEVELGSGLTFMVKQLLGLCIIYFSDKILKFNKNLDVYIKIYLLGICLNFIFFSVNIFMRIGMYFYILMPLLYSILIEHFNHKRNKVIARVVLYAIFISVYMKICYFSGIEYKFNFTIF